MQPYFLVAGRILGRGLADDMAPRRGDIRTSKRQNGVLYDSTGLLAAPNVIQLRIKLIQKQSGCLKPGESSTGPGLLVYSWRLV